MNYDDEDVADIVAAVQNGDLEVVKEALDKKIVGPSTVDKDGCSLLHWTAINNRYEIAKLLISYGADVNAIGGKLGEMPLSWAARKKFKAMCYLLLINGANPNHISNAHLTPLHLALKSGDKMLVYMLLNFGADPNSLDSVGDPILIWLLKTNYQPTLLLEYVELLLQFRCSVTNSVDNVAKNTFLHLVTEQFSGNPELSASLIMIICEKIGTNCVFDVKNLNEDTAFDIAWNSQNPRLLKYFFDLWLFCNSPEWIPISSSATSTMLAFHIIREYWYQHTLLCIVLSILNSMMFVLLGQLSLKSKRGRVYLGMTIGLILTYFISYLMFIEDHIWFVHLARSVATVLVIISLIILALFSFINPLRLMPIESRTIVTNSGIDDDMLRKEYNLSDDYVKSDEDSDEVSQLLSGSNSSTSQNSLISSNFIENDIFVDNAYDLLNIDNINDGNENSAIRINKDANVVMNHSMSMNDLELGLMKDANKKSTRRNTLSSLIKPRDCSLCCHCIVNEARSVSHCIHCNCCCVDADHHCGYLNGCVGKGNRWLFCAFSLINSIYFFLFFVFGLIAQFELGGYKREEVREAHRPLYDYQSCDYIHSSNGLLRRIFSVQMCVMQTHLCFGVLTWLALVLSLFLITSLYQQILYVGYSVTTHLMNEQNLKFSEMKNRQKDFAKNIIRFLSSGEYEVIGR